jgi:hypothetical protein
MTTTRELLPTHYRRAGRPLLGYRADQLVEGDVILGQLGERVTVKSVENGTQTYHNPHTKGGQWTVVRGTHTDGTPSRRVVGPSLRLPLADQPPIVTP